MNKVNCISRLKKKAEDLKKEITTLYFAYKHPNLPILPKIIIIVTVAYALSPIDLIPDFIPVLGYLDDLIILPLLISLSIKLIPGEIMAECRIKAENKDKILKPNKLIGAFFILIWILILMVLIKTIAELIK